MFGVIVLLSLLLVVAGSSVDKPHFHNGVLPPYDGLPIKVMDLTEDQQKTLDKELPVSLLLC